MKNLFRTLYLIICISIIFPHTTFGNETNNALKHIKTFIQNIQSVAIEFEQIDIHNNKASGMLLIDKPYKFRCNYYPPFPIVIIGNKNYVSLYDYDMENISRMKSTDNIFYFLLEDNIDLNNKFSVVNTEELSDSYKLKLYHSDLNRTSAITFDKNTGHITLIQIFEDNNIITLSINSVKQIKNVKQDLFIIQNPEIFGPPIRYDQHTIREQYQVVN